MWQTYLRPASLDALLDTLEQHKGGARLIAGGTDVLVELARGVLPTETLIDVTAVPALKYVADDGDTIRLGALATHNDVIASSACVERTLPLAQACREVGAPQIRTRATVAGNLITASPANDTIAPLMALGADLVLVSRAGGERIVPLADFYRGVRQTILQPGELLREIRVSALRSNQRGRFVKLGLRRAQAISVINVALVLTLDGATVTHASITLGCLAPTIVHARAAESYLTGRRLDAATCAEAGRLARVDARPIDDLRGSARYRLDTLAALVADALRRLAAGREHDGWPEPPILLETPVAAETAMPHASSAAEREPDPAMVVPPRPVGVAARSASPVSSVRASINGRPYTWRHAATKTLLHALREDASLIGAKEGCAEGECGACTVWLDGQAVMSCLVPAAQAQGARITTIEGLASTAATPTSRQKRGPEGEALHPLQRAFIERGAVQCGFCIPGMLMAGAKLLEEQPRPTLAQAQEALGGNICRCTGYRKILDAVLAAGAAQEAGGAA
jgi:xanthine dehydrogenase iron-sulfur cluster and FAD-binding subunit A